tara:strand:+ start:806 stop:1795 length:990 start_codon:yes stop_codon:yes gene_type:complete
MKKILVIGSNSFTGSHYVNHLLNKNYHVYGTSRSTEPNKIFLPYKINKKKKNFRFIKLDLNIQLQKLFKLINKEKFIYIVNFASQGMVEQSWFCPEDWYKTNTLTTIKLHDFLRKKKFVKRYVHISTPEVYGSTENFVSENRNYKPSTPYATSRAAADMSLHTFNDIYGFPVVFTRAANVYGPGQQLYRIIPKAIILGMKNKKIKLDGAGKSKRSFVYIDDAIKATFKIMLYGKNGEVYHISNNRLISIYGLTKKIFSKLDLNYKNHIAVGSERIGKDHSYMLKSQKLRKSFNWKEKITIDEGISKTIDWIKKNFNYMKNQNLYYKHKK